MCGCLTAADVVLATDVLAAIYQWNAEESISSVKNYHHRQCVCIALVICNNNRTLYTLIINLGDFFHPNDETLQ